MSTKTYSFLVDITVDEPMTPNRHYQISIPKASSPRIAINYALSRLEHTQPESILRIYAAQASYTTTQPYLRQRSKHRA